MSDVTRILQAAQKGDPEAAEELLPLVYDELRKLAAAKMAQERPDQTLQHRLGIWISMGRLADCRTLGPGSQGAPCRSSG